MHILLYYVGKHCMIQTQIALHKLAEERVEKTKTILSVPTYLREAIGKSLNTKQLNLSNGRWLACTL